MAEKKQWIVVTTGEHPLDDVAKGLEKEGFNVESKLDAIGQIIGTATNDAKEKALRVKGVSTIEPSLDVNVDPPGSDLTW